MPTPTRISEAYATLGLGQGASMEAVKAAYRQVALRTHPDKNPNNPEATKQFQQVGEAYNILSKHLDTSNKCVRCGQYHEYDSDFDDDDYSDDDYDSEMEAEREAYYRFLFEAIYNRFESSYSRSRFRHEHRRSQREHEPSESQAEFNDRIRRNRGEQIQAEQKRKLQAQIRKELAEEDRRKERKEREKRQKAKAEKKKVDADAERKKAEAAVRTQRMKTQTLRSSVFNAARSSDAKKVKSGIWESNVDAAGGEVKPGYEEFVKMPPNDPKETLLHIVAKRGDLELLSWLDSHNADPDERDSEDLTAFHVAVRSGNLPIVNYFLENHSFDGEDAKEVYRSPSSSILSTLRLAVESGSHQVVKLVLEKGLVTGQEVNDVWAWLTSAGVGKVAEEIVKIVKEHGGLTPPSTPLVNCNSDGGVSSDGRVRGRGKGRGHNHQRWQRMESQSPDGVETSGSPSPQAPQASAQPSRGNGHGRGRGRGREGRGRGRGIGNSS
ncbi:DnaJ-domain-containing protein [Marasmius fiardii PR-910]|nr:DnaJ-domain-containing protein [Marasmius fiardii PR-910]